MAEQKLTRRGITAPAQNGTQTDEGDDPVAKRQAFLQAVAAQVEAVQEVVTAPGTNPDAINAAKEKAVDAICAEFTDAPKDHVRDELERAIMDIDANSLPPGTVLPVKGEDGAVVNKAAPAPGPKAPRVIKNDAVANMPAPAKPAGPAVGGAYDGPIEEDDMVTANVPHAYRVRIDHTTQYEYSAGAQKMPRSHAEHWYSKAHGVTVVE